MKQRLPKGEKERLVAYLPVDVIKRVQGRALELGKTISLYMADLIDADLYNWRREELERQRELGKEDK